jgi:hypothetical protein
MTGFSITIAAIEAAAPDQDSLKAAGKLLSPAKWTDRHVSPDGTLIWGACQGSGSNPYRLAVDLSDLGAKCNCPSRKFPCKHALALMLLWSGEQKDFTEAPVTDWIAEWLGRRRKGGAATVRTGEGKSLDAALTVEEPPADPEAEAKREAQREKRTVATNIMISDGLVELEAWISDQLRTGLAESLVDLTARCRRIASRLVDARATALAARVDTIPARVLALPQRDRAEALASELGKLVILSRAWAGGDCPPEIRREVGATETREALLADPMAARANGAWEVVASREEARRDGLIARSTWLLSLAAAGPRFALLQDFYPASVGRQGSAFAPGDQFEADLVFYPAPVPLRAQIIERRPLNALVPWPAADLGPVLAAYARQIAAAPWLQELPLLLPPGAITRAGEAFWWDGAESGALPMKAESAAEVVRGATLKGAVVLWNAFAAELLAANTNLGRYHAAG